MKERSWTLAGLGLALALLAFGCQSTPQSSSSAAPQSAKPRTAHQRPATPPRPQAAPRPAPRPAHRTLVGQIVDRLPTRRRVVALTFDAGASDAGAPKILAALRATGAEGTFFLTGRWAEHYPQWARRIAARYPIGNHTFDHTDLVRSSLSAGRREILMASAVIARTTRRPPTRLFRFPYGSSSASTLRIANRLGYTAVGWTVDTLGWQGTSAGQSVESVITRALAHLEPGEIILMHVGSNPTDGSTLDADALATLIREIRLRGYTFVKLTQYL